MSRDSLFNVNSLGTGYSTQGTSNLIGDLTKLFLEISPGSNVGTIPDFICHVSDDILYNYSSPSYRSICRKNKVFSNSNFFFSLVNSCLLSSIGFGVVDSWLKWVFFAGGLVVHTAAGLLYVLGKRKKFSKDSLSPPHSPVLTMIGASMLWVGWFGFNGGSALAADLLRLKLF